MVLLDQCMTPTTTRVVESLDIPTGSPVVVLESREPKVPKVVCKETKKEGTNYCSRVLQSRENQAY
jgi:hypothetical protein